MANLGPDPLQSYTPDELLDLIERQSFELDELRAKSDQFEHLYVDIIQSTSWKLAWPIRAAFKVLTKAKKIIARTDVKTAQATGEMTGSSAKVQKNSNFDVALDDLCFFAATESKSRLNLLVSTPLAQENRDRLLAQLACLSGELAIPLRILSLDPQLTARDCQAAFQTLADCPAIDFTFHRIARPTGAKGVFRLDFGPADYLLVQTERAAQAAADFARPEKIMMLRPDPAVLPESDVLKIRQALRPVAKQEGKGQ